MVCSTVLLPCRRPGNTSTLPWDLLNEPEVYELPCTHATPYSTVQLGAFDVLQEEGEGKFGLRYPLHQLYQICSPWSMEVYPHR